MRSTQNGFTLVEIAIVLVIIGLLLGGVLKGQELINSAKAKSLVNDFRTISTAVYAYQDRFRFMPGDDPAATQHVGGTNASSPSGEARGNGRVGGNWNSTTTTDESFLVWQHLRMANLLTGNSNFSDINSYFPKNADNGNIGITGAVPIRPATETATSSSSASVPMTGAFFICSDGISARLARQVDATMDDGATNTGNVRAMAQVDGAGAASGTAIEITAERERNSSDLYTVCVAY
ncbi:prepilin-type N-terminal cleavage/methylation domain-containing protein [Methyloversatilis discipulorum]|uniref:prepilin-type N-terminal cleavage/methylation domain-containing protein n=1 Tax=Methyloversatilis discipulorum TaxID=1119528 RepID=UPI000366E766|nr:prepilin-type N-terminal cleavage/methylation domain-containing protein [Methyloversatilis discipulorum]